MSKHMATCLTQVDREFGYCTCGGRRNASARDQLDIHPPSRGALVAEMNELQARLDAIAAVLKDGDGLTLGEIHDIETLARGTPARELKAALKRWAPRKEGK